MGWSEYSIFSLLGRSVTALRASSSLARALSLVKPRWWRGPVKGMSRLVRGTQAVAAQAATFSRLGLSNQVVLVNGNGGVVSRLPDGRVFSVIGFTIANGKVVEMDILADPDRLGRLDLSAIER